MSLRRVLSHLCLAFLLLWTQQGAFRHSLSHWAQAAEHHTHDKADQICLECLAFSSTSQMAQGHSPLQQTLALSHVALPLLGLPLATARFLAAYQSRAPPR
jgi:hypothetical protein